MPKVKFQDVDETQQFKVIPEGNYVAEIVKVEETKTKNDDDMWKVQFKVIEGEHTGTSIFSFFFCANTFFILFYQIHIAFLIIF